MLVDESVKVRSLIAPARLRQSGNPLGITPDTAGSGLRFELNRTIVRRYYYLDTFIMLDAYPGSPHLNRDHSCCASTPKRLRGNSG